MPEQIAHYRIVAPLGRGGMGVVYEAEDLRLGRQVAIKVLPPRRADDPVAFGRLLREARAAASLNHPNICRVLDVGEENGQPFLVLERLEGRTLKHALGAKPMPMDRVLEVGTQMAAALEAAHSRGIVHRDIKPANVFLTVRGEVKLLDFGLAKFTEVSDRSGQQQDDATDTDHAAPLTRRDRAAGTAAFMSPEQARGEEVDARSDLFSLGAVLYQLTTGRLPFQGDTEAVVFEGLLGRDPTPVTTLNPATPAELERIVTKALDKDRGLRYQTAADLRVDLERARRSLASPHGASGPVVPSGVEARGPVRRPRRWMTVAVTGLVAMAIAAAAVWAGREWWGTQHPRFTQLTFRRGVVLSARFAPDGHTVVYSALWDGRPPEILSRRLEGPASVSLGLPPATLLAVSSRAELAVLLAPPDERGVLWLGTLARVPLSGGPVRPLLEDVFDADWSPDGRELALVRWVEGAFQLEYPQGTVLRRPVSAARLRVSPDGAHVALLDAEGIVVVDREGSARTIAVPALRQRLTWSPDSRSILVDAGDSDLRRTLRRVTLNGTVTEVTAMPGTLVVHDADARGRVLLHHGFERWGVRARAPGEPAEHDASAFANTAAEGITDDGEQVLLWDGGDGPPGSLLLQPTRGGPALRIAEGRSLGLSGDGRWVVTRSTGSGVARVGLVPTGLGEPIDIPAGPLERLGLAWMIDDRTVAVHAAQPGQARRTFVVGVPGGQPRSITPEGVLAVPGAPRGDLVLGQSDDGALAWYRVADGVEVRRLPWRLPRDPFVELLRIDGDGRSVFIRHGSVPAHIDRVEIESGARSLWRVLSPSESTGVAHIWSILLTPKADAYAYTHGWYLQDLFLAENVQ